MLTCGFASHHASCTVAQHSNSTITAAQDWMASALWVGGGIGTVAANDRGATELAPSARVADTYGGNRLGLQRNLATSAAGPIDRHHHRASALPDR
jgi:hypothetical protein